MVSGRYTLRAAVGHGGMGTVWRASDSQLGRNVAVKEVVPPPGIAPEDRDSMYQRMMREARAAASLSHPGIVQVYDVVTDSGRPWVVMELLDARSLSDVVLQDGPLAQRAVAKIGVALLGALEVAHAAGVLHRDVKPANVLICTDGRCVLTDFGVARMPTDQQLTTPGMVLGSPHFISPERAMGAPFGPPSDLFSLGVTLYTAVEGRPPFDKSEPIATMHSVVEDEPPPPHRAGPLTEVLYGLLEKNPDRRWDATRARQTLRDLLAGPLAAQPNQFPTDPYSVVPTQRQPWQDAAPATPKKRRKVGGRALLGPDEQPTERRDQPGDPARDRRDAEPARAPADDSTAAFAAPDLPDTGEWPAPAPEDTAANELPEAASVTWRDAGDRTPGTRSRRAQRPGQNQPREAATRAGVAARQAGAQGLAALQRLPRQAQIAAAAGVAMVVLIVGAWLFTGGGDDEEVGAPVDAAADPEPTTAPEQGPQIEVEEYAGRGVVLNYPAQWRPIPDDPDRSYIDFVDPDEARSAARLVVEPWGGEPERLVLTAEENIQANTATCAAAYERLDLREIEMAGRTGALLEYTCGEGEEQSWARWATVVHDGQAYSVRLTVQASEFEQYEPVFDELIRSFQITD
ncbi:protein kinase [Natronosporangium hydrolyticum]|uniref:non-specific serine/threonine protein kinase n=2 Tax=Natronosporangium hydrolyticum TaxID=2811111 RepID=A0A895YQR5_9ACTN|nr:protein kinase [Natronosporangium hydrolyticum]